MLTFNKEVRPEKLTPPQVKAIHKESDKNIDEHIQEFASGAIQGIIQAQASFGGYPMPKGPMESIHMHILKSENPWVKDLHIDDLHDFVVKAQPE